MPASLDRMPKIGYREKEAAAFIGVSVSTLRGWVEQGLMPEAVKIGGVKLYRADALVDAFDRLTANSAPANEWDDVLDDSAA